MLTEDPDDMKFEPGSSGVAMTMPAGYSYIMMNQNDSTTLAETSKQRMQTLSDAELSIKAGAVMTALNGSLLASISALAAFTAF